MTQVIYSNKLSFKHSVLSVLMLLVGATLVSPSVYAQKDPFATDDFDFDDTDFGDDDFAD